MALAPAKADQVRSLLNQGKFEQACAIAQGAARASPRDPLAAGLLSESLFMAGRMAQAVHFARVAADLAPADPGTLCHLAYLLTVENNASEAAAIAERAALLAPALERPRMVAAGAYGLMRRYTKMIEHLRAGLEANPRSLDLASVLAGALVNAGRIEEGFGLMKSLADANPDNAVLAGGVCVLSNYMPGPSPGAVAMLHRRYGEVLAAQVAVPARRFANAPDPERRLKVAIISPDLRAHSVASFIEPLLRGHDPASLDITVYQTNRITDAVTRRLQSHPVAWRVMDTATDARLAEAICAAGTDVAVELSGHTEAHSLVAMHLRPAPVLATYCGYPNTTGLAIDWRIVDSVTDPPGESDALATERLWRLDPCFLCYAPPSGEAAAVQPGPTPPPAVTFASFNALQKINDRCAALWGRVLDAAPGSRLSIKAFNLADDGLRETLLERLRRAGIDPARVDVLTPAPTIAGHLAAYSGVSVALDTVPYNGTTTTCEALWMGVPVVALAGDRHASRVGASLLHAAGLGELVARDDDGFVRIAAGLGNDRGRLAEFRRTLRPRLFASPVCDGARFCRRFEGALRGMWREWCGKQGAGR